ncbi:MAG: hypothetical protein ACK53Y_02490, partial [bacterium]
KSDSVYTVYVYSDSQPIASTPQPRHRPISLLMAFFCIHPIAIDFSSIEKCLQYFAGLWFTIFADEHFPGIYPLRWLGIFQQQPSE